MTSEFASAIVLALCLFGLAGLFAWRALRALGGQGPSGAEDRRYYRNQALRGMACAVLMIGCAGMILGWFFLEDQVTQSAELAVLYWVAVLLLVLVIVLLAAFDFLAIARFGLRHHRQIVADRRAMMENHAARPRSQRNGDI